MLYQNKENQIFQFTELDVKNGFIPKDLIKLTEAQLKAYENKPEFGTWNGNGWNIDEVAKLKHENSVKKIEKEERLSKIVVTTENGNTFDGNETARNNMTGVIISADVIGRTEEYWKLADNTVKLIQLAELKEALALSIQEVGNIVTS